MIYPKVLGEVNPTRKTQKFEHSRMLIPVLFAIRHLDENNWPRRRGSNCITGDDAYINVIKIGSKSRNLRAAECRPYGKMAFVGAAFCRPWLPICYIILQTK